ncbi:MAG: hypothetical protein LJE65_08380 [Desulfobacteraceae bacterium]|nr:hypothetical protein [Desulfobacteraceae bacterium]
MNIRNKFFWFVATSTAITLLIIAVVFVLFWNQMSADEKTALVQIVRHYFVYVFSGTLLLIGIGVFIMDGLLNIYIIPISRLIEEAAIITFGNPSHRIKVEGSKEIVRLAEIVNEGAGRYEMLRDHVDREIRRATAEVENEKNILAAVLSEVPQGVIICNTDGQILLFNSTARELLGTPEISERKNEASPTEHYIGLGRSIFGIVDRNLVVHGLDEISAKLDRRENNHVSSFIVPGCAKSLLRVEMVPVLNSMRDFNGFVLILNDITEHIESDSRTERVLQRLITGIRRSSAGIRSAVETVIDYPEMDAGDRERLLKIIHGESQALGELLESEIKRGADRHLPQWPLAAVPACELVDLFVRKAQERFDIALDTVRSESDTWVRVDTFSLLFAMLFIQEQLLSETRERSFGCRLSREGGLVSFSWSWHGSPIRAETIRSWEERRLSVDGEALALRLGEILRYHRSEVYSYTAQGEDGQARFNLFLPAAESTEGEGVRCATILPASRPEFYDFDLFSQPGQVPELDERLLTQLTCTVFDTETTGLNPAAGDEIISIGAVRIVNGKLLREDVFDQLVDPRRDLPEESIRIHGIRPEMLAGQPTVERILPLFQKFAEDTVLVGHNAAFDMRMLQVKEAATGVRFINPVLDTLLLSAVVHPSLSDHDMEAIADRLGVPIVGRHTALGDAIVTGEIFLKLIPLLAERGIRTLKEARSASQQTYYARLRY